jgi:tripartite-type tricarboxylate transporter receptor subunit TctC
MRRRQILAAPLLAAPLLGGRPAAAQGAFPTRPIRMVVPWAPGGATGNVARIVGDAMTPSLGQPIVLDHRPGAGGGIGSDNAAKSPGDGYTLLISGAGTFYRPLVERDTPFNPQRDFGFLGLIGVGPFALVTRNGLPNSIDAFLAYARARPGQLNFATSGQGATSHLATEMFNRTAGITATHVPYRGSAPAMIDLIGGRVDYFFDALSTVLENARQGRIQLLAVTTASRARQVPEVPTIGEAALPGFTATPWWGLNTPAGVPAPALARMSDALRLALAQPAVVTALEGQGVIAEFQTPAEFERFVWAENAKWAQTIEAAGLRVS